MVLNRPLYVYSSHNSRPGVHLFVHMGSSLVVEHAVTVWLRDYVGTEEVEWCRGHFEDIVIVSEEHAFAFKLRWC